MEGTIFWNLWFSIVGFVIYFLIAYDYDYPVQVISESFISGVVFFLVTYIIRRNLTYFLRANEWSDSTKVLEKKYFSNGEKEEETNLESEQIAAVVKRMLEQD